MTRILKYLYGNWLKNNFTIITTIYVLFAFKEQRVAEFHSIAFRYHSIAFAGRGIKDGNVVISFRDVKNPGNGGSR